MLLDTSDTYTGTPLFMAPEIICGGQYTKDCDIYSMGSVIFMLCAGYAAHSTAKSIEDLQVRSSPGSVYIQTIQPPYILRLWRELLLLLTASSMVFNRVCECISCATILHVLTMSDGLLLLPRATFLFMYTRDHIPEIFGTSIGDGPRVNFNTCGLDYIMPVVREWV